MMGGITSDAGGCRKMRVCVYTGPFLIHAGTEPDEVPAAMDELFTWLATSHDHPLIKACFFHCAFECIHPFSDGNGRTGRLWHTLITYTWKPILAWLPVETMVDNRRQDYYQVLGFSNTGDATLFIEYMLEATRDALVEAQNNLHQLKQTSLLHVGDNVGDTTTSALLELLKRDPSLSASQAALQLGVSKRHVERLLASLKANGAIERIGPPRGGYWKVLA
jgi:Fic family protein